MKLSALSSATMYLRFYLLVTLVALSACNSQKLRKTSDAALQSLELKDGFRIAFGSCNKHDEPQPLWKDIASEKPDLWIWLGDIVYADTDDMDEMAAMYDLQKEQKDYTSFREEVPKLIGIWDDHDYGVNDGDKTYSQKKASRDLALEFLDVPRSAPVWSHEGLYQAYEMEYKGLTIRVVLLDCRYFRDPIKRTKGVYEKKEGAELLGEVQWKWLEQELSKKEDVLIIGSGIQFISEEHRFEKWANFPTERARLFNLLKDENAKQIILLSGDRHIGEIASVKAGKQTIYEVTSSGLTHSYEKVGNEPNRHRVGPLTGQLNYGIINITKKMEVDLILAGKERKRLNAIKAR